jgi:hypothetical protein
MDGKKQKLDPPKTIFQLKVTPLGTDPPIWRRLTVPYGITFHEDALTSADVVHAATGKVARYWRNLPVAETKNHRYRHGQRRVKK